MRMLLSLQILPWRGVNRAEIVSEQALADLSSTLFPPSRRGVSCQVRLAAHIPS